MKNRPFYGGGVGHANSANDISNFCNDDIRQHTLIVFLGQGHNGTEEYRQGPDPYHRVRHPQYENSKFRAKDGEDQAKNDIRHHFGH